MSRNKSIFNQKKPPEIGDLVYHILYGPMWLGVLLDIAEDNKYCKDGDVYIIGLVHMIPNTKHSGFFNKGLNRYMISDNMGYVSMRWLRSLT
jgi:hypothetical protein